MTKQPVRLAQPVLVNTPPQDSLQKPPEKLSNQPNPVSKPSDKENPKDETPPKLKPPEVLKQKPDVSKPVGGRPRKTEGVSRTTDWRRRKEQQLSFNDLSVNHLINQAKKTKTKVNEDVKKHEKRD